MATRIEWTDRVWNPVTGCDRTSPGCDFCYAMTMAKRLKAMGQPKYQNDGDPRTSGPGFGVTCHPSVLGEPLRWRKPSMVFVNSMSDLFHPDVPEDFIHRVFKVMVRAPQHTFQVLTKRPQRMVALTNDRPASPEEVDAGYELGIVPSLWDILTSGVPAENVWLGASIESDRYTFRADHVRRTNAAIRFLSLEPLLGPLPSLNLTAIDWVIVGGKSGPHARPMHPEWVRDLRNRCQEAGVAFFFKQDSGPRPGQRGQIPDDLWVKEFPHAPS